MEATLALLDGGKVRVAQKVDGAWQVNQWLKKAVLLSFRIAGNAVMPAGDLNFYDKVPLKYQGWDAARFEAAGVRVVPPATVRRGAFVASNVVLMPSYVNLGAYVDSGTMVDTWATVGSCAQIGRTMHLSGGVGIGGVLSAARPPHHHAKMIGFIGARSKLSRGHRQIRGRDSMGVFISQSTRIYDRERQILYGRVPAGAVVVPGTLPREERQIRVSLLVIVKRVDAQTRAKTSINELRQLRLIGRRD